MNEEQGNRPKLSDSLGEAARLYAIPHYTKDIDVHHIEEYPYDTGLEAAFIAGAQWQKEQMMKDAVECVVYAGMKGNKWIVSYIGNYESMVKACKVGDKVRIIIVKEDER